MVSGIYQIRNTVNSKIYIGSAKDIYERWCVHRYCLRKGKHHSHHLQSAWNMYGEDKFSFEIIETIEIGELISREQFWIDKSMAYCNNYGYNECRIAGSSLGRIVSAETRIKLSMSLSGEKNPNFGKKASEETRKKMSASHTRNHPKQQTEIAIAKIKIPRCGYKLSEETKRKMSAARTGLKRSEETKAKMRIAQQLRRNKMRHGTALR